MGRSRQKAGRFLNNQGSTLLIVVVVVALISVLSLIILSMTVANVQMKAIDYSGKSDFYNAESGMQEIYAGLGKANVQEFEKAYNQVFENFDTYYNDTVPDSASTAVRSQYLEKMVTLMINNLGTSENGWDSANKNLFQAQGNEANYNLVQLLQSYVQPGNGGTPKVVRTGKWSAVKKVEGTSLAGTNRKDYSILVEDVQVEYEESGTYSTVTVDIMMGLPEMEMKFKKPISPEEATLALQGIMSDTAIDFTGNTTVKGNLYAGESETDNGINVIAVEGENRPTILSLLPGEGEARTNVVTRGNVTVRGNAGHKGILEATNVNLWCNNLQTVRMVQNNLETDQTQPTITFEKTNVYVADDMELNANGTTVTFNGGSYYGYNYNNAVKDNTLLSNQKTDHTLSSAIMINGKNSMLFFRKMDALMVAGRAYIDLQKAGMTGDLKNYKTGESVSIKGNQSAYLVPTELLSCKIIGSDGKEKDISITNPMPYDVIQPYLGNLVFNRNGFFGRPTWLNTSGKGFVVKNVNGQAYFYLDLTDKGAPDYMKAVLNDTDYNTLMNGISGEQRVTFDAQRNQIKKQVLTNLENAEIKGVEVIDTSQCFTSGTLIEVTNNGTSAGIKNNVLSIDNAGLNSIKMGWHYENLYEEMLDDDSKAYSKPKGPLTEKLIDYSKIKGHDINDQLALPGGARQVVIVDSGNVSLIDHSMTSYKGLIIAGGDVTIDVKQFTGAILAKGKITVKGGTYDSSKNEELMKELIRQYPELRNYFVSEQGNLDLGTDDDGNTITELTYQDFVKIINWRKNENDIEMQ